MSRNFDPCTSEPHDHYTQLDFYTPSAEPRPNFEQNGMFLIINIIPLLHEKRFLVLVIVADGSVGCSESSEACGGKVKMYRYELNRLDW